MSQDKTDKILGKAADLQELVNSPFWKNAKEILLKRLAKLDSIELMITEGKAPEEVVKDIEMRKHIYAFMTEWLKEVEGEANVKSFTEDIADIREEEIFIQFT